MTLLSLLAVAARSAVLLGLALAAMPLLRRAPASTRRLVLACALAAAAAVPVVSRAAPEWRVLPAADLRAAAEPFAEPTGEAVPAPSVTRAAAAPSPATSIVSAPAARAFSVETAVLALWAFGALCVLGRLVLGLAQAQLIARRSEPFERRAIAAAMREAGVRARVRVSSDVDAPAVTGVFSPVVLVPRAALSWDDSRWRAVLLHELAHVRQRDCLAQITAQIACAMHWYSPLVWLAARRLRAERELSADEQVLSAGTLPTEYAAHLLAIARVAARGRAVPGGALGMAARSQLLLRVEAIVRPGAAAPRMSRGRATTIAALAVATLGVVACATPGVDAPPPSSPPAPSSVPVASATGAAQGPLAQEVAAVIGAPADRIELTIRPEIQAIVDEEMNRLDAEWHPVVATAIVLDPSSGEVLAIANPAAAAAPRVSGSTMKALLVAAALEEGAITPADRFSCDNGARDYGKGQTLHDASPHADLDVAQILTVSSNIGASRIYDKLGGAPLVEWLRRFHLGAPTGIQLRAAPVDALPASIADGSFAGAALGGGHAGTVASPLHMAAAYAAIANHGVYNSPGLVRRVLGPAGAPSFERRPENERLLRPETAAAVMGMLERVVTDEGGTGAAARVAGVRVAGKTGTSDEAEPGGEGRLYASFIGVAPAESPRFVILVGALTRGESGVGGKVAAPAFARIAARALGH